MNQIPKRFWSSLTGLVGILIALVAIMIIGGLRMIGDIGVNHNNISSISVEGTGNVLSVPDVATFSFTVTQTAKAVADAQTNATTKANAALKAVRDAGVADKDISTLSYSINPHYDYQTAYCPASKTATDVGSAISSPVYCPGGKNVLTGYEVSETIQVKVRDLTKAGAIFTSIGGQGVSNIQGLDFSVDDPTSVQAQARDKAIANAKAKADVLAKQLGVSLVRVISFSENSGGYPRPMYAAMAYGKGGADTASAAVAPEIPVGDQKVTSNVNITYEIK